MLTCCRKLSLTTLFQEAGRKPGYLAGVLVLMSVPALFLFLTPVPTPKRIPKSTTPAVLHPGISLETFKDFHKRLDRCRIEIKDLGTEHRVRFTGHDLEMYGLRTFTLGFTVPPNKTHQFNLKLKGDYLKTAGNYTIDRCEFYGWTGLHWHKKPMWKWGAPRYLQCYMVSVEFTLDISVSQRHDREQPWTTVNRIFPILNDGEKRFICTGLTVYDWPDVKEKARRTLYWYFAAGLREYLKEKVGPHLVSCLDSMGRIIVDDSD